MMLHSSNPFVSSVVETPIGRACLHGLSTTLEANGVGNADVSTQANVGQLIHV